MSDHAFRVYKALRYIDLNLFAKIDLDSIAGSSAFSPFHFHRVFSSLIGMSVSEYVRRRRMSEAAQRLLNIEQGILDLALECHYESQEAFTRAFKNMYDITPGQLRKAKKSIESERSFTLDDLNQLVKGEIMKPEIKTYKAMRIIGLARTYEQHNLEGTYDQWGEFMSRLLELSERDMNDLYGISMESHPDVAKSDKDKYVYLTAVEVSAGQPLPKGMIELNIPSRKCAKFIHKGHIADYISTYKQMWNNWIPENKLEIAEGPEFEIYGERFHLESAESEVDILIPIKN